MPFPPHHLCNNAKHSTSKSAQNKTKIRKLIQNSVRACIFCFVLYFSSLAISILNHCFTERYHLLFISKRLIYFVISRFEILLLFSLTFTSVCTLCKYTSNRLLLFSFQVVIIWSHIYNINSTGSSSKTATIFSSYSRFFLFRSFKMCTFVTEAVSRAKMKLLCQ